MVLQQVSGFLIRMLMDNLYLHLGVQVNLYKRPEVQVMTLAAILSKEK